MMTRRTGTTLLALLIAGAGAARADKKLGTPTASGTIVGRVIDQKGRPIAGAEVWGVVFRGKVGSTRTDTDGRFRLTGLKEDKAVTVWAEAPGVSRERRDEVHVFAGRDHDIGPLTLLPGTRIAGRVVDAKGRPVPGASIKVEDFRHVLGHTIDCNQTEWTLTSDSEGRFATPHLPAGEVWFRFAAPSKVRTHLDRYAVPGTAEIVLGDVTLADEVPLHGLVVDQDGAPAPGVRVVADYDHDNPVTTDKDGKFTVTGVGPVVKTIILRSNNYFTAKPVIELGAADRADLKLTMTKAYEIHGTTVDAETGKPVPIETVRLCTVARDPEGSYTLHG